MTEGAFQIHAHVIKCGLACDVFVGTRLLHFYGTFGWVVEVDKVFKEIEEPNIVSWTSLMVGYAYNGCVKEVMSVYRRLMHLLPLSRGLLSRLRFVTTRHLKRLNH